MTENEDYCTPVGGKSLLDKVVSMWLWKSCENVEKIESGVEKIGLYVEKIGPDFENDTRQGEIEMPSENIEVEIDQEERYGGTTARSSWHNTIRRSDRFDE